MRDPAATAPARAAAPPTSRTRDWHDARWGDGREHPDELEAGGVPQLVERTFVFVDLCAFTRFCDTHGPLRSVEELGRFRDVVRSVAVRRGVRVAKWLGDGVMLVALDAGAAAATAVEVVGRVRSAGELSARAGVCSGAALLFDGDDHIGRPVNLAARLCDLAGRDEVLVTAEVAAQVPAWIASEGARSVEVRGVGEVPGVHQLVAGTTVSFAS